MLARTALTLGTAVLLLGCSRASRSTTTDPAPSASTSAAAAVPDGAAASPPALPSGYVACRVGGVTRMPGGANAVLLVEESKRVALPIFIGGTEALAIRLRIEKKTFTRPLTHDLFDSSIKKLGGHVASIRVDKIEDNTFHGTLVLDNGKERFELDARPSDAIAIALGNGAPIHVSSAVLEHAGLKLDELDVRPPEDEPLEGRPPPITL